MMTKIYMAFYKKKRKVTSLQTLWFRVADTITKAVTLGKYSHCELVIDNGTDFDCYSSSIRDKGVRFKTMALSSDSWDLVDISHLTTVPVIKAFYAKTSGMGYDVIGLLSPVVGNLHDKNKYFCSEWCGAAIGILEANKLSPISLYRVIKKL